MSNDDLNEAIQLIQQGRHEQAQPILQSLIQANPQDLTAWSSYVKSCRTPDKRLKALEACLRFNPGNAQILEAIQKLQEKLSVQQTPVFSAFPEPSSLAMTSDPYAYEPLAVPAVAGEIMAASEPARFIGLDESPGRPFIWYEVWLKAMTQANVDTYTALVRDPLASPGRAYWWIFLAGIVTGLVSLANPSVIQLLNALEKQQGGAANFSAILAVALVVLVPVGAVFSVLGLMLGAAIYNLLAKSFGGSGSFVRTVYLLGAYSAPFSIVTGILSIIPLVSCLTIPLGFYSFLLAATSVQAAHRLNGGRATIVVLIPTLLVFLVICLGTAIAGQALMDILKTLPENSFR